MAENIKEEEKSQKPNVITEVFKFVEKLKNIVAFNVYQIYSTKEKIEQFYKKDVKSLKLAHGPDGKYDMVIVNNDFLVSGKITEHFNLFPSIFDHLKDHSFLTLYVLPDARLSSGYPKKNKELRNKLNADRAAFYGHTKQKIPGHKIRQAYKQLVEKAGFRVSAEHFKVHTDTKTGVYVYTMELKKS